MTILSRESWQAACAAFGREVDPQVRRANLLVEGLDLAACRGGSLQIDEVAIDVIGETRPCELLDDDGRIGLCASLRPELRGGIFGRIRAGGELRIGAVVLAVPRP